MNIEANKGTIRYGGEVVGYYLIPHDAPVPVVQIIVGDVVVDSIEPRKLPKRKPPKQGEEAEKPPMAKWVEQNRNLIGLLEAAPISAEVPRHASSKDDAEHCDSDDD